MRYRASLPYRTALQGEEGQQSRQRKPKYSTCHRVKPKDEQPPDEVGIMEVTTEGGSYANLGTAVSRGV